MASGELHSRDRSASLYEQVRRDLLQRIADGEFKAGDLLPTEETLCKEYGVSRITVRRAVADLVANYIVTRKRGLGTIVTRRLSDRRVFRYTGYFSDTSRFGSVELLNRIEPASEEVAAALDIEPNTPVRHSRHTAQRDGETFTFTDAYTLTAAGSEGAPAGSAQTRLGTRAERGEQELAATKASALVARHLGIKAGRPIMFARRVLLDGDDRPVRYSISSYHPDRYRFTVDLRPSRDSDIIEPFSHNQRARD